MASGRFVSVTIAEDYKLNKMSLAAEFVYLKTIPHLDRDGMVTGIPGLLYSKVCPLRPELFGQMQHIIDEWVQAGLVTQFMSDEGEVLFFRGFLKNNNLPHYNRERESRFPCPPGYIRTDKGLVAIDDASKAKNVSGDGGKEPLREKIQDKGQNKVQDELQDSVQDELQSEPPLIQLQEQEQEEDQDQEEDQEEEEGATPAAAACNPELASIWAMWQDNMPGTITPLIVDQVTSWLREYSAAEIREGIRIAVLRGQRTAKYVEGCLRKGVFSELPAKQTNGNVPAIKADRTAQAFANVRKQLAKKNGVLQ